MMFNQIFKVVIILTFILGCATSDDITPATAKTDLLNDFKIKKDLSKFTVTKSKPKKERVKNRVKKVTMQSEKKEEQAKELLPSEEPEVKEVELTPAEKTYIEFDKSSELFWNSFEPRWFPGEIAVIKISYFGITVGNITMKSAEKVYVGEQEAYHYVGHMMSARYYSMIYSINDTIETFLSTKNFSPLKYTLTQRESGKDVDDLQLYDFANKKAYFWYKRVKKGVVKKVEKENPIPRYAQDMFSIFHFIRGLPFSDGKSYTIPVVSKGKVWRIKAVVKGKETITVAGKDFLAFKIMATTNIDKPKEKQGKLTFWFSANKRRRPLLFEAEVKLGSISGEVINYTP